MTVATNIKVVHDSAAYRQVLESPGVSGLVYGKGDQMASIAGEGFECRHGHGGFGGGRPVAWVGTKTYDARIAEAHGKKLTRAKYSMAVR